MLPIEANGSPDPDTPDQPPDPAPQHAGPIECLLNRPGVAGLRRHLAHNAPIRALDAMFAIPFGVSRDDDPPLVWRDRPGASERRILRLRLVARRLRVRRFLPFLPDSVDRKFQHIA